MASSETSGPGSSLRIDTSVSHSARVWNYWLGGKDNYPVDHQAGDQIAAILPSVVELARASRAFLVRAVRYLAGEAGIRQFLDIGTGLPTASNTHEVAQATAPECRIVYVDNDPLVLVHARALLTSTPEGVTAYVDADFRDPGKVLREASRTLDFTQPIGLLAMGTMEHVMDTKEAYSIVNRLLDRMCSGSYLALYDPTTDGVHGEATVEVSRLWNESGGIPPIAVRSSQEIAGFFGQVELLEPGVVPVSFWRPDPSQIGALAEVNNFGGVGRKP